MNNKGENLKGKPETGKRRNNGTKWRMQPAPAGLVNDREDGPVLGRQLPNGRHHEKGGRAVQAARRLVQELQTTGHGLKKTKKQKQKAVIPRFLKEGVLGPGTQIPRESQSWSLRQRLKMQTAPSDENVPQDSDANRALNSDAQCRSQRSCFPYHSELQVVRYINDLS
jgi:hypothetical protein